MYVFKANGEVIGYSTTPNYIKFMDNGCYGLCKEEEAVGVAVEGTPYRLDGKEFNNLPVAEVEEIEDHEFFMSIKDMQAALNLLGVNA